MKNENLTKTNLLRQVLLVLLYIITPFIIYLIAIPIISMALGFLGWDFGMIGGALDYSTPNTLQIIISVLLSFLILAGFSIIILKVIHLMAELTTNKKLFLIPTIIGFSIIFVTIIPYINEAQDYITCINLSEKNVSIGAPMLICGDSRNSHMILIAIYIIIVYSYAIFKQARTEITKERETETNYIDATESLDNDIKEDLRGKH